jgi:hypothetical protein
MTTSTSSEIAPEVRGRLVVLADAMIPAGHGMPAASEVGVHAQQLDRVVGARPDIAEALWRALDHAVAAEQALAFVSDLERDDPDAYAALIFAVVGGYYIHPEVRRRLHYNGQEPAEVHPEIVPYLEEGLIDLVEARGPIYRAVPESI